jgi:hypothetical protein
MGDSKNLIFPEYEIPCAQIMGTFKLFALNFTLIDKTDDAARRYPNEIEAPSHQSEKRAFRPQTDAPRRRTTGRLKVGKCQLLH